MEKLVSRVKAMDRQQLETIFTSSAFMITAGLTFLNTIMLSRALDAIGRGAVAAAFGNTIVLGWAFQIGVPASAAYFAKDIDNRRVMMSSWAMTALIAVPMAALLTPFYLWQMSGDAFVEYGSSLKFWYIAFIILSLFNGPFFSSVLWLRGVGNTVKFNFLLALPQLLITLGYAGLWVSGRMTVNSALTSTFAMTVIGWSVALIATNSLPGKGFSKTAFRQIRNYSLRSWVGNLSFVVSLRVDQMLLVGFVSVEELGIYAVAAAFSTLSGPVARGAAQSLQPFVRNATSDEERLARIKKSLIWVALASVATLSLIALTAQYFLPFLLRDNFSASVKPLLILLPGAFATDINQVYTTALSSFNRPEDASKAQIVSAFATAIGLATLVSPYGITGAAITTSLSYWVALVVAMYYWHRLRGQVLAGEVTGHTEKVEESVG